MFGARALNTTGTSTGKSSSKHQERVLVQKWSTCVHRDGLATFLEQFNSLDSALIDLFGDSSQEASALGTTLEVCRIEDVR